MASGNDQPVLSTADMSEERSPTEPPDEQLSTCNITSAELVETLDNETLQILGKDPNESNEIEYEIHSALAARWSGWLLNGIKKEEKTELLSLYANAKNCSLKGQLLNPEVSKIMTPSAVKRDKYAMESQDVTGSALLALGLAISLILNEKDEAVDRDVLLKYLVDAGKLLSVVHHQEAISRKAMILPGIEKNMKIVLENTKLDKYLFGENLSEKIKSEKSLEKTASDLKVKPMVKTVPLRQQNNLNYKNPPSNNQDSAKVGNRRFLNYRTKSFPVQKNPTE